MYIFPSPTLLLLNYPGLVLQRFAFIPLNPPILCSTGRSELCQHLRSRGNQQLGRDGAAGEETRQEPEEKMLVRQINWRGGKQQPGSVQAGCQRAETLLLEKKPVCTTMGCCFPPPCFFTSAACG